MRDDYCRYKYRNYFNIALYQVSVIYNMNQIIQNLFVYFKPSKVSNPSWISCNSIIKIDNDGIGSYFTLYDNNNCKCKRLYTKSTFKIAKSHKIISLLEKFRLQIIQFLNYEVFSLRILKTSGTRIKLITIYYRLIFLSQKIYSSHNCFVTISLRSPRISQTHISNTHSKDHQSYPNRLMSATKRK